MNSQFFTLLAIDDSQINLKLLEALISEAFPKASILFALSGEEGMEICHAQRPDIVLLDIVMPGMDGYEVCTAIKSDAELQHIPVVMITTESASKASRFKAMEAGADAFLSRPLDESELTVQIKTIIRLKKSEDRRLNLSNEIAQRKSAEKALMDSRQQLLDIIDFLPDATFVVDNQKKVIAWNKAMEVMTGVQKQDALGFADHEYTIPFYGQKQLQLLDLLDLEDEDLISRYNNIQRNGLTLQAEIFAPALYKGKGAYISVTGAPLFNSNGERSGSIESIRDITDRKQTEKALQESEEKYRSMVELLPDAVIIHAEGKILFTNEATFKLVRAESFEQIAKKNVFDFVHIDHKKLAMERVKNVNVTGAPSQFFDERLITLDNEIIDVEMLSIPVSFLGQKAVQTIVRDISVRKEAGREITRKDELLNLTGKMAKIGAWEFDADTHHGTWTAEVALIHDLDPDMHSNVDYGTSFYSGESLRKIEEAIQEAIKEAKPYDLELEITSAKGIHKWIRTMGVPVVEHKKVVKIRGIFQDITDRKTSELIIENERLRLRTLIETIPDLIWLKDPEGRYMLCNPVFEKYIGYTQVEITGKMDSWSESKVKKSIDSKRDRDVIGSGSPVVYQEWVTCHADGQKRLLEISKTPMYGAQKALIGVLGVGRDITAEYLSQKSLREREEIYSTIVNLANDSIVLIDSETGGFLEFNDAACLSLGYTRQEFTNLSLVDIKEINPEQTREHLQELKKQRSSTFEAQHKSKDGQVRDVRVSARYITIRGKGYLSTIWSDMTEKNHNDAMMREKDLIFQSLLDNSPVYIFFKDHNLKTLYVSKNYENFLGKSMLDLVGKDMFALYPPEEANRMIAEDKRLLREGRLIEVEQELNGRYFTTIKFPILRDDAPPIIAGFTIDTTERRQAEAALRDGEALMRTLVQSIPALIWLKDTNGVYLSCNTMFERSKGLRENDIVGKTDYELVDRETADGFCLNDRKAIEKGKPFSNEEWITFAEDGRKMLLNTIKTPMFDSRGLLMGVLGVGHDITERKKVEEALHESEALYRNLVERLPDGVYKSTHAGKFIEVNPAMVKMLGYANKEELLDIDIKSQLYFKSSDRESAALQEKLEEMGVFRLKKKDGSQIWVEDHGWYILDDQENILFHEGIMRDITERKSVEDALKESESLLRESQKIAHIGSYAWNITGGEWKSSRILDQIFGIDENYVRSLESWTDIIHPGWRTLMAGYVSDLISGKYERFEKEYQIIRKDDAQVRWVHGIGKLELDNDHKPIRLIGTITDITERKWAEEALHESESLFRNLVERLPDGVYKSTHEGKFVDVNPAMVKMLGYDSKEELMAIDIKKQLYFDEIERESIVLQENHIEMGIYRLKKKDGSEIWIEDHGWFNLDSDGTVLFHEGIMRDITDRKYAQDEIILLNAELEHRVRQRTLQLENTNKELEAFSYSVSHDLRAPLRGIDGWSLALLEDYNHLLDDQGRLYLERVRRESQRMGILIDDLLKLSRVSRFEMKKAAVNISGVVQTIVDRLRESQTGRNYEFLIQPGLQVLGDAQMLEIALTNILENASKFTVNMAPARIEFGMRLLDGLPTYYVQDNGVGFDMEYAAKLFGAFQRMHKQTEFPGTGIGLATVQRIISRHGGRIWADSKPGKGATFYFTLTYNN